MTIDILLTLLSTLELFQASWNTIRVVNHSNNVWNSTSEALFLLKYTFQPASYFACMKSHFALLLLYLLYCSAELKSYKAGSSRTVVPLASIVGSNLLIAFAHCALCFSLLSRIVPLLDNLAEKVQPHLSPFLIIIVNCLMLIQLILTILSYEFNWSRNEMT